MSFLPKPHVDIIGPASSMSAFYGYLSHKPAILYVVELHGLAPP
jgi:hypothetical protein